MTAGIRRALLLCLLAIASAVAAETPAQPDVRFIIDVSAGMAKADPDNLRGRALVTLLRLLPDDARGGVWTYGKYVNMLVKHGPTDDLWKEVAAAHAAKLGAAGLRANLVEAVDRATWDRSGPGAGTRHLVLLSAGHVEVSDSASDNAAAEDRLLKGLLPELAAAGFRIHTLALSQRGDLELLRQLSLGTGGYHAPLTDAEALRDSFVTVLGLLGAGSDIPLAPDRSFSVDPGVAELTLLDLGDPWSGDLSLTDPEGRVLTRTSPRTEVRWHLDSAYQMVSVENPLPGRWRIGGKPAGPVRLVTYSDIEPRVTDLPATVFPGELRTFELMMMSQGEPVADTAFLDLLRVSAELTGPEGTEPVVVERGEGGRYQLNLLGLRKQGDYELRVAVAGRTFERLGLVPFGVRNPLVVDIHPAEAGLVLWIEVAAPGLDHRSLRLAAALKRPPAPATLFPLERMPGGLWKLEVEQPKGFLQIELNVSGNYLNERDFSLKSEPIQLMLPVTERQSVDFDAEGRPVLSSQVSSAANAPPAATGAGLAQGAGVGGSPAPPAVGVPSTVAVAGGADAGTSAQTPPATVSGTGQAAASDGAETIPWWFAAVLGVVNLLLGASAWWLLKAPAPRDGLGPAIARLRDLAGLPGPDSSPAEGDGLAPAAG